MWKYIFNFFYLIFLLERFRDIIAPTCFFFKSISQRRIWKLILFYYLSLITRQYLFTWKKLIFINFAWWQWISYCRFLFIILSSIFMISFCILSKRFFLKLEKLSHARVASITKTNMVLQYIFFFQIHEVFKANIWWMVRSNLLNLKFS